MSLLARRAPLRTLRRAQSFFRILAGCASAAAAAPLLVAASPCSVTSSGGSNRSSAPSIATRCGDRRAAGRARVWLAAAAAAADALKGNCCAAQRRAAGTLVPASPHPRTSVGTARGPVSRGVAAGQGLVYSSGACDFRLSPPCGAARMEWAILSQGMHPTHFCNLLRVLASLCRYPGSGMGGRACLIQSPPTHALTAAMATPARTTDKTKNILCIVVLGITFVVIPSPVTPPRVELAANLFRRPGNTRWRYCFTN